MSRELQQLKFCEAAAAVTDLWLSLPKENGAVCPAKKDFSPVSLRKHLSSVVLYERMQDNNVIVRVAGTNIREMVGQEITGQNLFDILPPEFLSAYQTFYQNMTSQPCAGVVERPIRGPGGSAFLVKTLQLPLTDTTGNIRYFLGVSISSSLPKHYTDIRSVAMTASRNLDINYYDIGTGTPETSETSLARGYYA